MKKDNSLFEKIGSDIRYQGVVFVVLMTLLWIGYYMARAKLDQRFIVVNYDYSWVYQVDSIEETDGKIVLTGFAFEIGKDADTQFDILLVDTDTGKGIYPKIEYCERDDVNQYFLCEYDYTQSGFIATVPKHKLDLSDGTYEVLVREPESRKAYSREIYYSNYEMVFADPDEFVAPEVSGTELEQIVNDGVLRVYQKEYGTYVYQYEGELYWIVERGYNFDGNDYWYVQYQMNTTQTENLPQERLENNHFWSNIGFVFNDRECIELGTDKYRVAKREIPTDYSVTDIWTGNHVGSWIWREYFHIRYDFVD